MKVFYLKRLSAFTLLICLVFAMAKLNAKKSAEHTAFHNEQELAYFAKHATIPIGAGDYFLTAAHCNSCHGYDSTHYASVDSLGNDINIHDDWKATMMANSAKDPFWRAKVSHEILVNPGHTLELQNNCTSCHAPMGNYTSKIKATSSHYTIATMLTDSLGLDGVSCVSCHAIGDSAALGKSFSGQIPYDTSRIIYGPYPFPMAGPMLVGSGYEPAFGAHMNLSKTCSPCHTLINNTVDLNGNYTGTTFVEQATYQEWLNSDYPGANLSCQKCHMPQVNSGVIIANDNFGLTPRAPFSQHIFAGANSFMIALMKQNKTKLGIDAADRFFDSTLFATNELLQKKSLSVSLSADSITADTAFFTVTITNKAGHKFPSGYPSRRAVLQFVMKNANNDTLFQSGIFTNSFRVRGESANFVSHQNVIRQDHQSQIYEMVMGDVAQQITTVAERAAVLLKDNRIPPLGFTSQHNSYDTTKVSPDALSDADFNRFNGIEGTGSDKVHFHVPISNLAGFANASVKVFYQSVPPKWLDEMFAYNSAEIDSFQLQFNGADQTPVLIGADSIQSISLATFHVKAEKELQVGPSISSAEVSIWTDGSIINEMNLFNSKGEVVSYQVIANYPNRTIILLPKEAGVYYLRIRSKGKTVLRKVVKI